VLEPREGGDGKGRFSPAFMAVRRGSSTAMVGRHQKLTCTTGNV
jgi:hypothetical protein